MPRNKENTNNTQAIDTTRKYDPKIHPDLVYNLMINSKRQTPYTEDELADIIGVKTYTIQKWKQRYPDFKAAWKKGKDDFIAVHVENAFFKTALGYEYTETSTKETTVKAKDKQGKFVAVPATETTTKTCYMPPNQKSLHTALFKLLPEYKETREIRHNHNHTGQVEHKQQLEIDLNKLNNDELEILYAISQKKELTAIDTEYEDIEE